MYDLHPNPLVPLMDGGALDSHRSSGRRLARLALATFGLTVALGLSLVLLRGWYLGRNNGNVHNTRARLELVGRSALRDCERTQKVMDCLETSLRANRTLDAWGNAMVVRCDGHVVSLISAGADGVFGTVDDLRWDSESASVRP